MKLSIDQINEAATDFPIPSVQGTLKALFPAKSGTNSNGEWSIQRGVLQQGASEIEVLFNDRDGMASTWKGRDVIIESFHGDKGWSGVYAADDTYKDKTKRIIKVTKTGVVSLLGDGAPARTQQPAKPTETATQAAPNTAPSKTAAAPQPANSASKIADAVAAANQVANLQLLCINKVETYVAPRVKAKLGREIETSERHAWAMNLCIELMRKGVQWSMPAEEMHPKPAPPSATSPREPADNSGIGMHGADQNF